MSWLSMGYSYLSTTHCRSAPYRSQVAEAGARVYQCPHEDVPHTWKKRRLQSSNVLGTGEIGLTTRVWDKVARLMNLQGFSITISEFAYKELKVAKNESISDNLLDLAVYAIIWMLYRTDQWGR